jgi:hypothetical protein
LRSSFFRAQSKRTSLFFIKYLRLVVHKGQLTLQPAG